MAESVIHWFRRDLRLDDNLALAAALRTEVAVIPVFILDSRILGQSTIGRLRLQFLRTALEDLDLQLSERGSRLLVLETDDAARELNRLAEETGAWAVFFNRDYTPYARWRDTRVTRGMQMTGVVTMPMDDLLLVPPHATLGTDELLPTHFGAFSARWFAALDVASAPPDEPGSAFMPHVDLPAGREGWRDRLGPAPAAPSACPGATPAAAGARLKEFVDEHLAPYPGSRSRLSAALKFGTISVRRVASAVLRHGAKDPGARTGVEAFMRSLARREFAHHLLFNRPWLLQRSLREASPISGLAADVEAWADGRTGDVEADAAMSRFGAEGWLPNELRLTLASRVATTDWRAGQRHFARLAVDHDVAISSMAWQAAAGVGVEGID